MILFALLSCCVKFSLASFLSIKSNSLPFALINVTQAFQDLNGVVNIINFESNYKLVDKFFEQNLKSQIVPYKVQNFGESFDLGLVNLSTSAILIFESIKSLEDFNDKVELSNVFPTSFSFFVYCHQAGYKDIESLNREKSAIRMKFFRKELTTIVQYQYFIIEEKHFIRFLTFSWYEKNKCGQRQLIEVNRFEKSTLRWINENFVFKRYENFNGCELMFGITQQSPAFGSFIFPNGSLDFWGYGVTLIVELGITLNYKITFNPSFPRTTDFYLRDKPVDLFLYFQSNQFTSESLKLIFNTLPFVYENSYIAVPPGEDYTGYEKLLLPFDRTTWVLIALTFSFAFVIIFLLSNANQVSRDFVFGRNVRTPSLNVTRIIFGISQVIMPSRTQPPAF